MQFTVSAKCDGSRDKILGLLSDGNSLPEFWHGMREIRNIGGNRFEVRFQFPGKAIMEYTCDPERGICSERYLKGPFTGTKVTEVTQTDDGVVLTAVWNVKLSLMLRPVQKSTEKHFREGNQNALRRMCSK